MADAAVVMQPKQAADGGAAVAGDEEIQLTDDGGLSKKLLVKGEGSETPEIGDEVTVHYVGTLEDGTEFDSSRGRGDPFKFTLGQGNVIKGWDKGVATFTKGEKSLLKCRSDYAYGDRGSPPKIGPGATLLFEVELLHWKSSKDISNDGGVLKTTLPDQQGDGWERPKLKDEVLVKYEVRMAGSDEVAAASPPEGAEFPLDQAGPLRAFGVALPTMKKGEAAKLLVRPDYGFADAERPAGVPADAGLEATLQLVSWKTYEDVSGDGGVVKKTLSSPGSDWKKPNQGANVKAHLMGRLVDGTVFEDRDLEFVTDEEQVPEGLDLAVQKMKKGEVAEVTLAPRYAFGVDGAQREAGAVPPDATVTYTVTLNDFENAKETWAMSDQEKVAAAAALKEKGNARFKAGKWAAALAKHKAAAELAEQGKTFEKAAAELQAAAKAVAKGAQLNQVACHARLGDHRQAVTIASKVLESDRTNVKALYRRAQAYLELGEFLEAEADIKRALSEEPNNAGVRALHKLYKQKSKSANQRDKAVFSKMFKPSKAAAPAAGSATAAGIEPVIKEAEAVAAAAQQAGGPELMEVEAPVVNGAANKAGQP